IGTLLFRSMAPIVLLYPERSTAASLLQKISHIESHFYFHLAYVPLPFSNRSAPRAESNLLTLYVLSTTREVASPQTAKVRCTPSIACDPKSHCPVLFRY